MRMHKAVAWPAALLREVGVYLLSAFAAQFVAGITFVVLDLTGVSSWDPSNHAASLSLAGYLLVKAHARYRREDGLQFGGSASFLARR
jgi:hypothetical protein